jgi:4-hydroxy-2-oxoheptanedioate aldolase
LIVAAENAGTAPFVRVRANEASLITAPLDAGAWGVQIPQVSDRIAAHAAVEATRYQPLGMRGSNPYVRSASYGTTDFSQEITRANDSLLVVPMIEGAAGIDNIDDILETPGIDAVWVGPYDLSQSLGIPGQVEHADVADRLARVVDSARKHNVAVGAFAPTLQMARRWLAAGVKLIAVSYDIKFMYDAARDLVASLSYP